MPIEELQNGRYRRLRRLGVGGMGEVYLMEDTRVNRQVAIKVIGAETGTHLDSHATRLFQREAQAIAALDHPNILPLYDFGEESLEGAKLTYMVMPYCEEGSFAAWLRRRGSTTLLSPHDVAFFITQAAEALQYAHDRQVMHLDVKPSNFLLRTNRKDPTHPTLLLADFGVARMSATSANSSRTIRGTPTAMAPEQWSGTPVPATDQYALAVMAYELLVGRPPFRGTMEQLMYQHFQEQAPAPSTFNPRLSKAIDNVLLHALAKRPENRFPTISAFADVLKQAMESFPTQTTLRPVEASPGDIHATLAINKAEAVGGTKRILTLPGGRKVSVSVPPGAYDGQVIRLAHQSDPAAADSSTGLLILTLAVRQTEPATLATDAEDAQPTILRPNPVSEPGLPLTIVAPPSAAQSRTPSNPHLHLPSPFPVSDPNLLPNLPTDVQASDPKSPAIIAPPLPAPRQLPPTHPLVRRKIAWPSRANGRIILLIGVALLLIAASMGLFSLIQANQVPIPNPNATATAMASNATRTNTGFLATVTAIAQTNATATASVIAANPNPYGTGGTLALYDPLRDNSLDYHWDVSSNTAGGVCQFQGDAYHVSQSDPMYFNVCLASPDFRNFAYEAQMRIIKGDGGGIVFRVGASQTFYRFDVYQDGSYDFLVCPANSNCHALVMITPSSASNKGLNQTNLLAVVANGSSFTFYINHVRVSSFNDRTFSSGQIGMIASPLAGGQPTEVVFSNARVWTF